MNKLQNIQVGIDLGTTNSEISVNKNGNVTIVKNIFGSDYTPSVFGFDKLNHPIVGQKAYEKLFRDPSDAEIKNFKAEVKRIMGTQEKVFFPRINQSLLPEQISAEILKSLKEDVLRKFPEICTSAAVITTPASFDTIQAEATKRAGNLAGFQHVILLQEPIAAAIAYGYQNIHDENVLVYDLGGGTFDVALISSKGGVLSVLSHNGDNFLGGKDFDTSIIREIIIPQILDKYSLQYFEEQNPKYRSTFAQLKCLAEAAKVDLSSYTTTTIDITGIRGLEKDDNGKEIILSVNFSRKRFEQLIKPLIEKTITLSRKTIQDSGLTFSTVKKILLVGGPTQIPFIRNCLQKELKIPIDTSLDPLTVVAKGAGIYAISQQIPDSVKDKIITINPEMKKIILHFSSLTSEPEETISGIVNGLKEKTDEYYIQIQSENGHYTSSKINLKNSKFFDTVPILPHCNNIFWIYLFDKNGIPIPVNPDAFSIIHGLSVAGAPIPHAIGIAVAKKEYKNGFLLTEIFEPIFEKGSILPLQSEPQKYLTIKTLKKGQDTYLPIKVYEGESEIPDRNTFICDVKILGKELPYDLPENTEIELILKVDESRGVELEVIIPIIDRILSARGSTYAENLDIVTIKKEFNDELTRMKKIESVFTQVERTELHKLFDSIEASLKNVNTDEEDKRKTYKQLKELKVLLDKIEKDKEMQILIQEYNERIFDTEYMILEIRLPESKKIYLDRLNVLKNDGNKAITENDKILLKQVNELVFELGLRVFLSSPGAWAHLFEQISESPSKLRDEKEAKYLIEKGKQCISSGDTEGLRDCVINLIKLLPKEEQTMIKNSMSGITR